MNTIYQNNIIRIDASKVMQRAAVLLKRFYRNIVIYRDSLFYVAYGLYVCTCFLGFINYTYVEKDTIAFISNILKGIVLALLILKYSTQHLNKCGHIVSAAIIIIGIIPHINGSEDYLLWLALFIVASEGTSIRYLLIAALLGTLAMLSLDIAGVLSGVVGNAIYYRGGTVRLAMGLSHPNEFAYYIFYLCTLLFVATSSMSLVPAAACSVAALIFVQNVTGSRTAVVGLVLLLVFMVLYKGIRWKKAQMVVKYILMAVDVAAIIFSIIMMISYDGSNTIQSQLNDMLSSRLSLAHTYYVSNGVSLFGADPNSFPPIYAVTDTISLPFVVDNAFDHLMLLYGIVPSTVFLVGVVVLLGRLTIRKSWNSSHFALSLILLYGLSEHFFLMINTNVFLLMIGTEVLYGYKSKLVARRASYRDALPAKKQQVAAHYAGK